MKKALQTRAPLLSNFTISRVSAGFNWQVHASRMTCWRRVVCLASFVRLLEVNRLGVCLAVS